MSSLDEKEKHQFVENRSIDFIPEHERHGSVFGQFTLWFGANLQITAIVTGALAVVLGGDVFWSIIGLLIGQCFGAVVMALHAAQGPKLGLPQMISSRVQFGVYGACIPIVLVCLMYIGFTATGEVLAGKAIAQLINVSSTTGILIYASFIVIFATIGYRLIHWVGKFASVIGIIAFVIILSQILTHSNFSALIAVQKFSWPSFLLAISLSASWQISFGPYVADYSRYLPSNTSSTRVFLAVGLGSLLSSQISMTLGVFIAQISQGGFVGNEVQYVVGMNAAALVITFLYFSIAFGKVTLSTLNAYGCFMCIATIWNSFKPKYQISKLTRLSIVLGMVAISTLIAILGEHTFLNTFKAFILFLLTFFIPWSAINLVDYYFISKEECDVAALYDPNGKYGRWNSVGIGCYVMGVLLQLPFIHSKFFTGTIATALGGIDISWLVGLLATAVIYYYFAKKAQVRATSKLRFE